MPQSYAGIPQRITNFRRGAWRHRAAAGSIPRAVLEKFFTTKARGTGLGLATEKRVIDAHLGTISIECPAEGGTTVTVQLPVKTG
ncbi:unnamed protein product [uncultured bacterium]|nr:unnamed protein product [uncultured bacterium]